MKVYVCYECYYDYCDEFETAVKIFDDEVKAIIWKEEIVHTETEWRRYSEMAVE